MSGPSNVSCSVVLFYLDERTPQDTSLSVRFQEQTDRAHEIACEFFHVQDKDAQLFRTAFLDNSFDRFGFVSCNSSDVTQCIHIDGNQALVCPTKNEEYKPELHKGLRQVHVWSKRQSQESFEILSWKDLHNEPWNQDRSVVALYNSDSYRLYVQVNSKTKEFRHLEVTLHANL